MHVFFTSYLTFASGMGRAPGWVGHLDGSRVLLLLLSFPFLTLLFPSHVRTRSMDNIDREN